MHLHVHFRLYQSMQIYARASTFGAGIACWLERPTRDRKVASSNPGRGGGEFSTLELTLCADSYSVSVPPPCYGSGTKKTLVILPKNSGGGGVKNKHAYTLDQTKSAWVDYATVQAQCGNPIRKRAHTQLVREHSATAVSVHWATVDWSWPNECNLCRRPNFHLKINWNNNNNNKNKQTNKATTQAGNELSNILPKPWHARKKPTKWPYYLTPRLPCRFHQGIT